MSTSYSTIKTKIVIGSAVCHQPITDNFFQWRRKSMTVFRGVIEEENIPLVSLISRIKIRERTFLRSWFPFDAFSLSLSLSFSLDRKEKGCVRVFYFEPKLSNNFSTPLPACYQAGFEHQNATRGHYGRATMRPLWEPPHHHHWPVGVATGVHPH